MFYILFSIFCILYSTYTLFCTLYTLSSILYIVWSVLYAILYILYSIFYILNSICVIYRLYVYYINHCYILYTFTVCIIINTTYCCCWWICHMCFNIGATEVSSRALLCIGFTAGGVFVRKTITHRFPAWFWIW